jgi:GNAT superfamily N-acetyltransferase
MATVPLPRKRIRPFTSFGAPSAAGEQTSAVALARRSWRLQVRPAQPRAEGARTEPSGPPRTRPEQSRVPIWVRGAVAIDLPGVARMHGRCAPSTLLRRYLRGGRSPSLQTLETLLHQPLVLVAHTVDGDVVGLASVTQASNLPDVAPEPTSTVQLGLLVEDAWQDRGIGRALTGHLAASALLFSRRELVADVTEPGLPLRRILDGIGPTRSSRYGAGWRLRTRLEPATLGRLGSVAGAKVT